MGCFGGAPGDGGVPAPRRGSPQTWLGARLAPLVPRAPQRCRGASAAPAGESSFACEETPAVRGELAVWALPSASAPRRDSARQERKWAVYPTTPFHGWFWQQRLQMLWKILSRDSMWDFLGEKLGKTELSQRLVTSSPVSSWHVKAGDECYLSFWQKCPDFELFVLLDYFTGQMFHKPGLGKFSDFLWHNVCPRGKGLRTPVNLSVPPPPFFPLFFFILTPSGRTYSAFSCPSNPSAAPGADTQISFCFIITLPLLVWIFGQVFRLFQSKADED